ncbi:glycosyltransferase [bacterium]|nr:glycosyltransferase [bacterium]
MHEKDIETKMYAELGEVVFKSGFLTRNIFKPWNFVKFILNYKKGMKKIYPNLAAYIDNYEDETLSKVADILLNIKKYWLNKKETFIVNNQLYKKNMLEGIKFNEQYAFEPVKNRICYCLNHSLPYRGDGYVTRSQHMAHAMQEAGFEVIAITRPGFPWDNIKKLKHCKNLPMEEQINGIKYKRQYLSLDKLKSEQYMKIVAEEWKKTFLELKPEYVIAASNNFNAIPALSAARELGVPFYYEVRGLWEVTKLSKYPEWENSVDCFFEKYYEARICKEVDGVFTLTTPIIDELESRGVDRNKVHLCPNCANVSLFNPTGRDAKLAKKLKIPDNVVTIGYLGTLQMYEGLDDLMQACAILKNKGIDFRLLLVGGIANIDRTNYKKYLENVARKVGIKDKLIMPGKVPPTEVPKYYSLMDITPFGRKSLPVCEMVSPIKPLEAMAMEKTVVVSDLAALKEIVQDNETGLYFEKGNIESYAETLEKAIKDKDLRERLGKNARKWIVENRQWIQNAETIKKVMTKETVNV